MRRTIVSFGVLVIVGAHVNAANVKPSDLSETVGWLCGSEKLHFYRSIYLTGAKGAHAVVCENDSKYMGIDMVNELIEFGACVPAQSEENKAYQLYFGAVNTRASR
jgi:hypothetical protein